MIPLIIQLFVLSSLAGGEREDSCTKGYRNGAALEDDMTWVLGYAWDDTERVAMSVGMGSSVHMDQSVPNSIRWADLVLVQEVEGASASDVEGAPRSNLIDYPMVYVTRTDGDCFPLRPSREALIKGRVHIYGKVLPESMWIGGIPVIESHESGWASWYEEGRHGTASFDTYVSFFHISRNESEWARSCEEALVDLRSWFEENPGWDDLQPMAIAYHAINPTRGSVCE